VEAASPLARLRDGTRRRRVRREARARIREARAVLRRQGADLPADVRASLAAAATATEEARARGDHDATCRALVRLDDLIDRHVEAKTKSTFREYVESIGVAILIALLLRAFVVEAFKIPSGSMIPTMEVGDHIFVNKFIYGIRIPLTKVRFFDVRKPRRGEVVVFIYPREPDKDFIKRIVGVEGDSVEVRNNVLHVNGAAVEHRGLPGPCFYTDYDEAIRRWSTKVCTRVEEELDGITYRTVFDPAGQRQDFPGAGEDPYVVPAGHVFVLGDNRNNSHDSRFWGPVPVENIKGKALIVWWSSGGPDGIRWGRLGKMVD
jgi:signal peptidase I